MCNLYSLNKKRDAVARYFRVSHNRAAMFEPTTAIFPKHVAPVVRSAADGEREIVTMSWGFMLLQKDKAPRPVTNVRDDTILKNSFWKSSFEERRCLVPASSFCEPNGDVKPATWHWFSLRGTDERPLFAFPGIWRRYKGPMKKDGPNVDIETYAFLTTTPNSLVATINHERMPALLTREEEFDTWLRGSPAEAMGLACEYPPDQMRIVQEGAFKEDRAPNRPKAPFFEPDWPIVRMLVVDPAARGRGVGRALMDECCRRARRDGSRVLALHTSPIMICKSSDLIGHY
jgi:putative SOS response-associated peptidase YedK